MSLTMYSAFIPVAIRTLQNLSAILAKGAAHCEARKIDPNAFLSARLYPDMFPLSRQVQIASDTVKGAAARLAGIEIPRYDDNETTFAELQARLDKTVAFLKTIQPAQIDGKEDADIVLSFPSRTFEFKGQAYLTGWVLPNLYFHTTTAYGLLRHGGVDLGKADYLGGA
ncbi:hypothetical protein JY96_05945 [Aquabacterium sp. NJ1]|uniref:DUF1993 domain-containing protein n=1 Tax=Aquabacterium sp. NJ1 TaxID=1538295 RepID=UPI00052C3CDA|nr:DUF1993 domain-containing protein [Aquabacterium sp. NJ1]KGM39723.1 hypothetical protein JY96_05945 [Aquabacterium sp. NJ1]